MTNQVTTLRNMLNRKLKELPEALAHEFIDLGILLQKDTKYLCRQMGLSTEFSDVIDANIEKIKETEQRSVELRTNMQYSDFLKACILDLEGSNNRTILAGMGELLSSKQKAWVKAHLIKDLTGR